MGTGDDIKAKGRRTGREGQGVVGDIADKHGDKATDAVTKAADFVDDKTGSRVRCGVGQGQVRHSGCGRLRQDQTPPSA